MNFEIQNFIFLERWNGNTEANKHAELAQPGAVSQASTLVFLQEMMDIQIKRINKDYK